MRFQDSDTPDDCGLLKAKRRLEFIERMLMRPTPQCIREAALLVQEASELLNQHSRSGALPIEFPQSELRRTILDFRELCARVSALLEGAQRVHWSRMRSIGAITQSYTASARLKDWKPQSGTVNLHF